ncbi:cobaltochelatase subunit CobN [Herpetosiphon geysericola]|uniref:Cobalt chelatase n=1 Tax=Herpetosiphon geysericola TaxID=70996 RepID=A0A0P6Y3V2_9CHLR|nr:cobaltochelatase subunit CobN [Herpetosiphon geysericola]KPL90647.1 cobalt chelatase [Herpetosiphon geysericola]
MTERLQRNMVERIDGRMVNAGYKRGMLFICAHGCCCGITERGFAPVWPEIHQHEWESRKLRNLVHLNMGGCLGPCPLANVAMLMFDGQPIWFHSLNQPELVVALYDYIEAMIQADQVLPAPAKLKPHVFNGFKWDGQAPAAISQVPALPASQPSLGNGIVFLTQADTDILLIEQARRQLPSDFTSLQTANVGEAEDQNALDSLLDRLLPQAEIVVVRLISGSRGFEHGIERLQQWTQQTNGFVLYLPGFEALDPELMALSNVGVPLAHLISSYFMQGGLDNVVNALACLSDHLLLTGWGYDAPRELPRHGSYTPALNRCEGCTGSQCHTSVQPTKPTVGVLFYRAHMLSGNTEFVDAICQAIDAQGMQPRAVYSHSLKEGGTNNLPAALECLQAEGPIDALICSLSFALGNVNTEGPTLAGWEIDMLQQLNVPIIQAIASGRSREQWQRAGRGLSSLDTAINVAIPEFDGRIITVPISFKEQDPNSGIVRYVPDHERVERVVGITRRLVNLRHKPNAEKRIAFVFTNSSAKASRVGNAVGLDAPASLLTLLHAMQAEGYQVGNLPASSDQLLLDLIDRCSYDETWLTEQQLNQAVHVPVDQYQQWFAELPANLQASMIKQWGEAPGTAYLSEHGLALAGLEFGNVFVALQPPRGYGMDPNAIYHMPDLPPPHSYYALYRWLRDGWQADALVHMGKHGTLEWLPGKSVGLSRECFPDALIADLPVIYPFIINDPGEGNQAKRRSHAVIIDHMTPPMTSAGAYGQLAELAQLVNEYYQVEQLDPNKLPLLQRQIWNLLQTSNLSDDLQFILKANHGDHTHDWDGSFLDDGTPTAFAEMEGRQVAHLLEDIEGYLCELTGAQIRDGLHILGTLAEGDQLPELLFHLTKLPNLEVPSLPVAVGKLYGLDWNTLQANLGERLAQPLQLGEQTLYSNGDVAAWLEQHCKTILQNLEHQNWQIDAILAVLQTSLLPSASAWDQTLVAPLEFIATQLIPNLHESARAEIASLLHALNGGYIPAGPSGAPTRGMAHVLPTGRNFYAVDPRSLPSAAAWQVGQHLADDLIRRYQREEGSYPRSVGISIWGTSAMRTYGDDIAQVLALLGVRPVWQAENRRITGVAVIPLAELGRPRINVVCRISGFFRDAFPHLVSLLDQAAQTVIELDEPLDQNFARQQAFAATEQLIKIGLAPEIAQQQARYRVWGCKPGSYGAGILPLIDSQNWQDDADFARAYIAWGGYAYTSDEYGIEAANAFGTALSEVQIATKNQDNREHDIFDSDDYMQYHGGMIATIRALTGRNPRRYFGDSSNPQRPQTRDLREEARRVFRSRVVNPKWIESMRRHGYKGALELAATVDYLFGYDATAQVVDDWMYHSIAEHYLRDEEMQQFFADSNPWAWQAIAERLLEAIDRDLWHDPEQHDIDLLKAAQSLGLSNLQQRGQL